MILLYSLERSHPGQYEAMGEPSFPWNIYGEPGWALLTFLFKREHKDLGDPALSRLSDFMLVFICTYVALFVAMIVGVLAFAPVANTT